MTRSHSELLCACVRVYVQLCTDVHEENARLHAQQRHALFQMFITSIKVIEMRN